MATTAATPIRKKRNFKALQLDVSQPPAIQTPNPPLQPIPSRAAPVPNGAANGGKRKPPMMDLSKSKKTPVAAGADQDASPNHLTVTVGPNSAPATGMPSSRPTYQSTLQQHLADLDMNAETKLDLRNEDLREISELGQGNGGSVKKVEHVPTKIIMAKKIVLIDAKPSVRKQILRELQIMHNCHSEHIVSFYGAFVSDPNICICMECMDKGSLDGIYKRVGPIPIDIVGKIATAVLEGLTYLYDVHRIIHRDIKPSNILFNSQGQIKICDFGVSGELINSIADTFVGTSTYMSPERIQGAQYTVKSDVWSLGISLIELALGRFPFSDSGDSDFEDAEGTLSPSRPPSMAVPHSLSAASSGGTTPKSTTTSRKDKRKSMGVSLQGGGMMMSILELLQHIVNEPAPKLTPEDRYPADAREFVDACLLKDPLTRPTPKDLLKYGWVERSRTTELDLKAWADTI
ncbi:Pkinase-domain-containing protein [Sistotremastrum niveocremeum HHB9708]|uniref:Pkinase-domain-containing protein n=2 Tax=Sistotremastraceae TaxID=3402574 RepID=A0A164TDC9_9AGAM|nr:Pkinase-domain-containing protein [Sistotremastrum niveocremeum HHB9708]KZT34460.1 Pkinase-domain-containing protein [Sistotremastrum suecicum HHB10207 ss-3]